MSNVLYLQCARWNKKHDTASAAALHTAVTATSDADVDLFLNFHMRHKPRLPHVRLPPME